MKYAAAVQKKADLTKEGAELFKKAEGRALTKEEKERDDAIAAELTALGDDIARMDRQRERERSASAVAVGDPENAGGEDEERSSVRTSPRNQTKGPFGTFAEQLEAIYLKASGKAGASAAHEKLLHVARYQAAPLGMNEAVDSEGAYLVQHEFASEILQRMNNTGEIMKRITNKIPLSGNSNGYDLTVIDETSRVDGSRMGGIRAYWLDEAGAPTATKPRLGKIKLELKRIGAIGYVTEAQLQDFPATAKILTDGFAEELTFKVEDAAFEGDGSGKPIGMISSANPSRITVSKENGQAADTVVHNNLIKMWSRLHARSRATSVWFINQDVEPQLDDLAKVIGTAGVEPNYVTNKDGEYRIKNRPVVVIEYAATLGDLGDISLVDVSQWAMIDKGGIQQANSMHVAFTTFEQAFRATYRMDGAPTWKSALTPFKGTNTVSPFIVLQAR